MNKQELLKSLNALLLQFNGEVYSMVRDSPDIEKVIAKMDGLMLALNLASQLEEPKEKKPVVPQFAVDWFTKNQYNLENGIYKLCVEPEEGSLDMKHWFNDNSNHAIEKLVNMQYGYSVEKLTKWVIKCPTGYIETIKIHNLYTSGDSSKDITRKGVTPTMDGAIRFTDKERAETLASIVDGTVEEWKN